MSAIRLLRERTSDPRSVRLTKVPRWVRPDSQAQTYWHIPRSAELLPSGMVLVRFFCGPSRWVDRHSLTPVEPVQNRCGTCEGRAVGFEGQRSLVFAPRSPFDLPKRCPSTGGGDVCAFCGGRLRGRVDGGGWREVRHTAGPVLARVSPCPQHGWRDMYGSSGDRLRCVAFRCGYEVRSLALEPHEQPHARREG